MSAHSTQKGMSRRRFLGATGAAVAAPFILPARARGANSRIGLGVLGSGSRGVQVMKGFIDHPDIEVVALCDVFDDRRTRAAALVNEYYNRASDAAGCAVSGDFREVIDRDDVDAVLIAPQDHWHAIMAVAAADRKKHIYCEKPLGVSVRECQIIRDAARRNGIVFQTGTQQRSTRDFSQACELARNGYLGDIHTIEVAAPGPYYQRKYEGSLDPQPVPDGFDWEMYVGPAPMKPYNPGHHAWPDWYLIWDYCVGFIVNWGVHHLDIALWGCPRLTAQTFELTCTADYRNDGFCDNVSGWQAEFVYPDGLKMLFSDTDHPYKQGCCFRGSEGWVHVNRKGIEADPASLLEVSLKSSDTRLYVNDNHQHDFVNAIKENRDPIAPVEAGCHASTFGTLADVAARLKRKIQWDPVAGRLVNDAEAEPMLERPMRAPWSL